MPLSNNATHYGAVAKTFHWLVALLILTLIPLGIIATDAPFETSEQLAQKAWLFSLHKTLGVTVFFVALLRILWALTQPKPALMNGDKPVESLLAETAHWLLYGSLILVPLTGWIHHASAEGYAPIWWPFGQSLPFIPKSPDLSHTFSVLHGIFEKVLMFTIIAHVLGALKHHFIDRDATLLRMLPGYPATGPLEDKHSVFAPLFVALVIWAAALGTGAGLGLFAQPERTEAAALAEVETDWTVTEGDIAITVQQMGSSVTGSFADWTASISYDETAETDVKGQAEVTISIPSLTLGTVTDQAMGPDYFNVEEHPTATFAADLISTAEGNTAEGTLTIKGYEQPITMPFDLTIDGDTATVNGTVTLDRRNYHVGDSMTDEGSLGYSVDVAINLTATRAAEGE